MVTSSLSVSEAASGNHNQSNAIDTTITMSHPFQVAALGASPLYPNSITWSDENVIAVATGLIVTILNPAKPHSPRGVITLKAKDPALLGTVERQDLISGCLLPICLARDCRPPNPPCVRSISWSPPGFASNYGCLLGVCTTEGSVKIYSHPFSELQAEWLEVLDVSDMMCAYFVNTNHGEVVVPFSLDENGDTHDLSIQVFTENSPTNKDYSTRRPRKRKYIMNDLIENIASSPEESVDCHTSEAHDPLWNEEGEDNLLQIVNGTPAKKNSRDVLEDGTSQHITADKYASRCALVSSLVIVWSPVVTLSEIMPDNSSISYCLLAIGVKSGHISLWRTHTPDAYSVEHNCPPKTVLAGLHQAHNAWVTALVWESYAPDALSPQLLLASGSSDGSVKIWLVDGNDMLRSSESNPGPFSLLTEVTMDDSAPISVLSLTLSAKSRHKIILAIGKGSGSVEVWTFNIDKRELKTIGCHPMHDHIVTGLTWAFDGCCLYSCGQDNSMRAWMFHKDSLTEVPLPPNNLSIKNSADLPCVYDSCFGVTVSPGGVLIAVVRSFDLDLLHPMYQARTQRAAIDFLWIGGGQQGTLSSKFYLELGVKTPPIFSNKELLSWGSNILWSLKQHERYTKHLVVWDIMTALLAFKQCSPTFFEQILLRWLVFLDGLSDLIIGSSLRACKSLPMVTSRQLHLLNIFCRRVMLPCVSVDKLKMENTCSIKSFGSNEQPWVALLQSSERELRERLVGFTCSSSIHMVSDVESRKDGRGWKPSGLSQISRWVHLNAGCVRLQLKHLGSKVDELYTSLQDAGLYKAEEVCTYCNAPVDFESAESASCQGLMGDQGHLQRHTLVRCAASMQVCPATPSWFCVCCERRSFKLMPPQFYALPSFPLEMGYGELLKSGIGANLVPLCPFCGILLQRLQPDFLFSPSPV